MAIYIALSTVLDGNMLLRDDQTNETVIKNRRRFLSKYNLLLDDATRVRITYDGVDYCQYFEVGTNDKGKGMRGGDIHRADALVTRVAGQALFLPLADCVGTTIYDPLRQILMLSHLGRHSVEQNGGFKSIEFLVNQYACDPSQLLVWLTPAPGKDSYPLFAFDGRSFKDVVFKQLQSAGINPSNITDTAADTTKDLHYYSHSEFLKGNQTEDGRYAVTAYFKD